MQRTYTVFLVARDIATNMAPAVLPGYDTAASTRGGAVRNAVERAVRLGFLLQPVAPLIIEGKPTQGFPLRGDDHHVGLWLAMLYDTTNNTYLNFINFASNKDEAIAKARQPMYAMGLTFNQCQVSLCRNFGQLQGPLLDLNQRLELCLAAQGFLNFYSNN